MTKYVKGKVACKLLGIHQNTLYQWEEKGWIRTIRTNGGMRMYDVEKYIKEKESKNNETKIADLNELDNKGDRLKISYVRVSSINQKDDLERQKKLIKDAYPNHIMIEDIGSGINLNKRGIRKIIKLAIEGKIEELVVAYKDRLTRFGYELIEDLIKEYSRGKIVILNQKDDLEPEEELAFDVLQIMNVFVAKMNGLRKYKKNNDNKSKKDINKKIEKKSKM